MSYSHKILIVVGARPQIMKAAALARALEKFPEITFEIIHSGQHYDNNMNDRFFEELSLKQPAYNLHIGSKKHNIFIAEFLLGFDPILEKEKPDMVVVVGDTNTTAAAAIATAKRNIMLAHVEAGLREWNKKIPEEVNKKLTDAVSDLYFAPTQTGIENLVKEGITQRVYLTGDITFDLLMDDSLFPDISEIQAAYKIVDSYALLTCHRAVNTDNKTNLTNIIEALNELNFQVIWPLHPRTAKAIENFNMATLLKSHVQLIPPTGYWETQTLIKHAKLVLTDSGGVIKEAYFHKTPSIIIDSQTEWIEVIKEGWSQIAGPSKEKIIECVANSEVPKIHRNTLGDGQAGIRIARKILEYLNVHKR